MNMHRPLVGTVPVGIADLSDPEELAELDAFALAQSGAQPFHRPQWSMAVERGCGQRALYLVAGGGGVAGVLPLTAIRSRLFGSALVSAGFAVGGGILARDEATATALADTAWALAVKRGIPSLELRGGHLPPGWDRREGVYANFARALSQDDDAILGAIPRKQRAEVRRALGFGLEVRIGAAPADRAAHYRIYSESVRNLGTPVFPRALFAAMLEAFGDDADILTISRNGTPLASVLSLYANGTVYPYWGGGTHDARHWRANDLLYYELMRHAARRGCTRFDFGRSKLGTGAYSFKKNWGFTPEPLVYASRTDGAASVREINPLSPKYRLQVAAWRRLPLWLANRVGPPIARGLG